MKTKKLLSVSMLLLLSLLLASTAQLLDIKTVQAYHGSSVYGNVDYNPPDDQERESVVFTCNNIQYCFDQRPSSWRSVNYCGANTTRTNMLDRTLFCEQNYDWSTAFYTGHSAIDQLEAPQHCGLYPNNYDGTNHIWDNSIWGRIINYNHEFVFLWSCGSANYIGGYDTVPPTMGPWGMAYCWTGKDDSLLSDDGYGDPWSYNGNTSFIGWQYESRGLKYIEPGAYSDYALFVSHVYYYTVVSNWPINDALDQAARNIRQNPAATFASTELYLGHDIPNPAYPDYGPPTFHCYMRVFGNGDMKLPL
jgi:hypothetical protein